MAPAELRPSLELCLETGPLPGSPSGDCYPSGLRERTQMEAFMLAFDSNLKPMVGQQLTLSPREYSDPALAALLGAAQRGDCDIALNQGDRAYLMTRPDAAVPGQSLLETQSHQTLALARLPQSGGAVTFTCHPPQPQKAEARRSAFDRHRPSGR